MEIHAVRIGAWDATEEVRAVFGGAKGGAKRPAFNPERVDGLDGDEGVVLAVVGDVGGDAGALRVIDVVQVVLVDDDLEDLPVLAKVLVFFQHVFLGDAEGEVGQVHEVSLDDSDVGEMLSRRDVRLFLVFVSLFLLRFRGFHGFELVISFFIRTPTRRAL